MKIKRFNIIKALFFGISVFGVVVLMSIGSTCVFISIYSYLGIKLFDILEK